LFGKLRGLPRMMDDPCPPFTSPCYSRLLAQALIAGDVTIRSSVILVCLVMLVVGLGLYFVNNLAQRRLDSSRHGRGGS